MFAGGSVALTLGAGSIGMQGTLGPNFTLASQPANPRCIDLAVALHSEVSFRLDVWVKRWAYTLVDHDGLATKLKSFCFPGQPPPPPPPPPPAGRYADIAVQLEGLSWKTTYDLSAPTASETSCDDGTGTFR